MSKLSATNHNTKQPYRMGTTRCTMLVVVAVFFVVELLTGCHSGVEAWAPPLSLTTTRSTTARLAQQDDNVIVPVSSSSSRRSFVQAGWWALVVTATMSGPTAALADNGGGLDDLAMPTSPELSPAEVRTVVVPTCRSACLSAFVVLGSFPPFYSTLCKTFESFLHRSNMLAPVYLTAGKIKVYKP